MKLAHAPGLALLLLCARMRVDDPQSRRILSQIDRGVDWKALLSLAHRHGLIPILHRTLSDLPAGMVPAEIQGQLQSMSEAFRLRNLIFLSELVRLQQAFAAADVVVMPYKGTALAGFLYRDAGLRQVLDVDLLVRPCDAIRARRVLLDQGCIPARTLSLRAEAAKVKYHFEFVFVSKGKLSVELQWRIAPGYWRLPEIEDFAWSKMEQLSLGGVGVPWFCRESLLLVLCLHGCKHKWDTLKWVVDVAELLRLHPELNWPEMMACARRTGAERMLALGLFLAHELLDAPLPPDVLDSVRKYPRVLSLAEDVCSNAFAADAEHATVLIELAFLSRVAERWATKLACHILRPLYFIFHRMVRPGAAVLRRVLTR